MPNAKTEIVRHTQHSQATLCDGEWVEVTTTVPFGPLAGHSTTFDELRGVTVILKSDGENVGTTKTAIGNLLLQVVLHEYNMHPVGIPHCKK